jgi:hypothetical protein
MQFHQGRAFQGQDQDPGGFLVQPMGQFQETGLGQLLAQLLDDAQADAAAAMDGLAGGLVDDQQGIVPIDHPVQQGPGDPARSGASAFSATRTGGMRTSSPSASL